MTYTHKSDMSEVSRELVAMASEQQLLRISQQLESIRSDLTEIKELIRKSQKPSSILNLKPAPSWLASVKFQQSKFGEIAFVKDMAGATIPEHKLLFDQIEAVDGGRIAYSDGFLYGLNRNKTLLTRRPIEK